MWMPQLKRKPVRRCQDFGDIFMRRLPTDLKILNAIYERYYPTFSSYTDDDAERPAKVMVPIDITDLARDMGVDGDIIFGRLYYHLEKQYGYRKEDDSYVRFFALEAGGVPHCVNFPYVASILAIESGGTGPQPQSP